MTAHANPCGAATTWVIWTNTLLVIPYLQSYDSVFSTVGLDLFKKIFSLYFSARAEPASLDRF